MIELACPVCLWKLWHRKSDLKDGPESMWCPQCGLPYSVKNGVPDLLPPDLVRDSAYLFEFSRYDSIARKGVDSYKDYAETYPQARAEVMAGLLRDHDVAEFAEIGPGFGFLLDVTPEMERVAVEPGLAFLSLLAEKSLPSLRLVRGVAERLPLATGAVPCLVADGVFQVVNDRQKFLYEAWRVCAPGALLVFTIGHKWNYPRRPQNGFDIRKEDEREMLRTFLGELDFETDFRWRNTGKNEWVGGMDEGDCLYVVGRKGELA